MKHINNGIIASNKFIADDNTLEMGKYILGYIFCNKRGITNDGTLKPMLVDSEKLKHYAIKGTLRNLEYRLKSVENTIN